MCSVEIFLRKWFGIKGYIPNCLWELKNITNSHLTRRD